MSQPPPPPSLHRGSQRNKATFFDDRSNINSSIISVTTNTVNPQAPSNNLPSVVSDRKIRSVNYDTANHWAVLTQMHGSVWPKVMPYCICNVLITLIICHLKQYRSIDLTFSDRGHTFMSMMVSFLIVTRSNIAYSRFMEARNDLNTAMKSCRELIQHAITFTRYETSPRAKQWRAEVARRTIVLLRTVVSVLEYQTKGMHAWKIPELTKDEKQALLLSVGKSNERSPMVLTMFMRSTISSHVEFLENPLPVNKELRLLQFVSEFVSAYHGLMKLVTTPFPFPLVQMARTFLFIWIFTLPFALVNDIVKLPALVLVVFFITYGFVGLEAVSIELDDPFGDDPNDFDVLGLAQVVFEDIYISIFDIDGKEAAGAIRLGLEAVSASGSNDGVSGAAGPHTKKVTNSASQRHQRYTSIDAWKHSAPAPKVQVGTDKSLLLASGSHEGDHSVIDMLVGQSSPTKSPRGNTGGTDVSAGLDFGAIFETDSPIRTMQSSSTDSGERSFHPLRPPRPPRGPIT